MANKETAAPVADEKPVRAPRKTGVGETTAAAPPPPESASEAPTPTPVLEYQEPILEERPETGRRRMPEHLRRYLIRLQGGKLYLPAAYRIVWFRDECPDWAIVTELVEGGQNAGYATVKATILDAEGRVIASDYKTETKQDFPAGWVEKASTGAISRALALAGFGTQFSPELDEGSPIGEPAYSESARHPPAHFAVRREASGDGAPRSEREPQPASAPAVVSPKHAGGRGALSDRPATEIWEGPGQCPRCHAPEGKRHGKPCIG